MPDTDVVWAVSDLNGRASHLSLRRDYYEGEHRTTIPQGKTLAPELRRLLERLTDNLCDDVVDEPTNRMTIQTWTGKAEGVGQACIESWELNRGDARARDVYRNAWGQGDGYVIVQQNSRGDVRWYAQNPAHMAVRYSTEFPDELEVAAKCWRVGTGWRLNLYYPPEGPAGKPRVERYATKGTANDGAIPQGKSFQPLPDDPARGLSPVEELDGDRIPVFHFPADTVGSYGRSALTRTVIGLQDVLNKSVADMVVAMEAAALPDRWATGIQAEIDSATGQEKPLQKTGRERMIRTGSKDASFGQFTQATMDPFLATQAAYRQEIARKGKLPTYTVVQNSTAPSGLSLLMQEGSLVKRIKTAQDEWGQVWRELMAYVLRLTGRNGIQANDLEVEWGPAETRDEKGLLEGLTIKVESLGLPKHQALIEAGYDADEVDGFMDTAQASDLVVRGGSGLSPMVGAGGMLPTPPVQPNGASAPAAIGA